MSVVTEANTDNTKQFEEESPESLLVIIFAVVVVSVVLVLSAFIFLRDEPQQIANPLLSQPDSVTDSDAQPVETDFAGFGLQTDTSQAEIDLEKVLSGGPGKDGIPAIQEPKFTSVTDADESILDQYRGILVEIDGKQRFYPYNILVWHEIVIDSFAGEDLAVTFCPLCGSAIVFDREVDGTVLNFGVGGLLYESNLLMFDRATESLWSQIEGRAVVGSYTGTELEIIDSQLLTFEQVKELYPAALILSTETGFSRNYTTYPYGDYDNQQSAFYFPVTYKGEDVQIPAKEIMYAGSLDQTPFAFSFDQLRQTGTAELRVGDETVTASYRNGEVALTSNRSGQIPGYYTMWFSWANHNLGSGVNPDRDGVFWVGN